MGSDLIAYSYAICENADGAVVPACHQHEPERRSGRKKRNRNGVPGRSGPILALTVIDVIDRPTKTAHISRAAAAPNFKKFRELLENHRSKTVRL